MPRKPKKPTEYDCQTCHDKGFVALTKKGVLTGEVEPCPDCNPDGMDELDD